MKKLLLRCVALILVLCVLVPGVAVYAEDTGGSYYERNREMCDKYSANAKLLNMLLSFIAACIPGNLRATWEKLYDNEYFLDGTDIFLPPSQGGKWSMGYSQASILPDDLGRKDYYIAGTLRPKPIAAVGVIDDTKVRTVCINDGTGRGTVVFSVIDTIGISNREVCAIREALAETSAGGSFASVNVIATHIHSSIDTVGVWSNAIPTAAGNFFPRLNPPKSVDTGYLAFVREKVLDSILEANANMTEGRLYTAHIGGDKYTPGMSWLLSTSDFSLTPESVDEAGISDYVWDRRAPYECSAELFRLRFVPDNPDKREIYIVNMAAHPYAVGLETGENHGDEISGDYIYYMEQVINEAGHDFLFINGAVAGTYTQHNGVQYSSLPPVGGKWTLPAQAARYGRELGMITLAMTMSAEEMLANPLTNPNGYSAPYYAFYRRKLADNNVVETEAAPVINIRHREIFLEATNPLMIIAGKLGLVDCNVMRSGLGKYKMQTEIGYLEIGDALKAVIVPGEIVPELMTGTSGATAWESFSGREFDGVPLDTLLGDEHTMVFGLANDFIGYVVTDNDYNMYLVSDEDAGNSSSPDGQRAHYQELLSLGKYTASSMVHEFEALLESVR